MGKKSLQPLLFVLVILIILFSYVWYIVSINPFEKEIPIEEKQVNAEEQEQVIEETIEKEETPVAEIEQTEPVQEKKEVIIEIKSGLFEPEEVSVPIGTKVIWVNNDRRPHTIADVKRRFYGDRFLPGDSYSFTFTEAGVYNYFDVVFFSMKGKIIVESEISPITGNVILDHNNPRLAGVAVLLLLGVIIALIFGRERYNR